MPEFCDFTVDLSNQCGDDYPIAGLGNIYLAPVRQLDPAVTVFSALNHDITALGLQNAGSFMKIEGKVSTKDLATENAKDGGGNVFNITANAMIPNLDTVTSFALKQYGKQKVVAIIELFEKDATTGNRKAIVVGLDSVMGIDAGATFAYNDTVEAEQGGVNGYNVVITGTQGESPRFFKGAITIKDGATTAVVNLG